MGQTKHTPGPWAYDIILDICTESEDLSEGFKQGVAEANARLITAAPKMLEALRTITKAAQSWHDFHHGNKLIDCDEICTALPAAEAAIQKAEGL